jgi:hypothetical protein
MPVAVSKSPRPSIALSPSPEVPCSEGQSLLDSSCTVLRGANLGVRIPSKYQYPLVFLPFSYCLVYVIAAINVNFALNPKAAFRMVFDGTLRFGLPLLIFNECLGEVLGSRLAWVWWAFFWLINAWASLHLIRLQENLLNKQSPEVVDVRDARPMRIPSKYQYPILLLPISIWFVFPIAAINVSLPLNRKAALLLTLEGALVISIPVIIFLKCVANAPGPSLFTEYRWEVWACFWGWNALASLHMIRLQEKLLIK